MHFSDCPGCSEQKTSVDSPCSSRCGYILSPLYPSRSQENDKTLWIIQVGYGKYIQIVFEDFDIFSTGTKACSTDYVQLSDLTAQGDAKVTGKYCNSLRPPLITTSSFNKLIIEYYKNSLHPSKGFLARYDEAEFLLPTNFTEFGDSKGMMHCTILLILPAIHMNI